MKLLIKQARVVDPSSPFNGQITDILIENGIISQIAKKISVKADQEISIEGLHVSAGVRLLSNSRDSRSSPPVP